MAHILLRNSLEKRMLAKQLKVDDIIVFDEDLPRNGLFTFVDFAPTLKMVKDEGLTSVSYPELIGFSNKWLQKTNCWDVITCETIPAIIEIVVTDRGEVAKKQILTTYSMSDDLSDHVSTMHSKLSQSREPVQFRVLLLRLWIKRIVTSPTDKLRPIIPQIQFQDFVPKRTEDEFENIDSVVERVNQSIRNEGIHGKILSVQTLACCAQTDWSFDKNTTQAKTWIGKMVYILRIFYSLGPIQEDEVGMADFEPECLTAGSLFKRPKFESQSDVLRKASQWLSENRAINFCNCSSIDLKHKSDTKQMSLTRETGDFIRIMRIAYTKQKEVPTDTPLNSALPTPPPLYLESRPFVIHKSYADVKRTIATFMEREEWTLENQYKRILLNCETVFVLSANDLKSSLESNSEQSFQAITSSKLSINRNLFFAIRLYYGFDDMKPKPELKSRTQSCAQS